jgi:putative peptidoglycan lipid II flippase
LLRGGHYSHADALSTARYFALFAVSLALWSAQGIYARAFYAARNTLTPAISGTIVTCVSIPIYAMLFHRFGVVGLAVASDIGIFAHTLALALLLHRSRLVSLASLHYGELVRALAAGIVGYAGGFVCVRFLPIHRGYLGDIILIAAGSMVWLALCYATLLVSGSKLPAQILRRR